MPHSDVTGQALRPLFPPSPRPHFFSEAHQGVHDISVRLETRVGYVCHRREEDIKQDVTCCKIYSASWCIPVLAKAFAVFPCLCTYMCNVEHLVHKALLLPLPRR